VLAQIKTKVQLIKENFDSSFQLNPFLSPPNFHEKLKESIIVCPLSSYHNQNQVSIITNLIILLLSISCRVPGFQPEATHTALPCQGGNRAGRAGEAGAEQPTQCARKCFNNRL
jgi:hypothetical protein